MREGDRVAEVLGAVSLAGDRARGQAPESILGTTILATRMARMLGLSDEQLTDTFYTAVTRALGCTSTAMDAAPMAFGDDLTFSYALNISDNANPESIRLNLEQYWAPHAEPEVRAKAIAQAIEVLPQMSHVPLAHSEQSVALSHRMPIAARVSGLLAHIDARWDGKNPHRPAGEEIPLILRIIEFTLVVEMYRRAGGPQAMLDAARDRAGGQFDPQVCTTFEKSAALFLDGFEAHSLWDLFLETEPEPKLHLESRHRKPLAEAIADFADNKSGWTVGHSRIVADLALAVAKHLSLAEDDQAAILLAGLMHDLGRCAVPNGVWDKPGKLSAGERRLAQSHSRHTEEILTASGALRPSASLASAAHEPLDGSGYHQGTKLQDLKAQLLAAADVFAALIQERSWREAHTEAEAIDVLMQQASAGRLSAQAVGAVLEARGHHIALAGRAVSDLTQREAEILEHLAKGLRTKQIAAKLGIAYKTADNHIQNIYRKIGATSRTATAMYAVEHGIYAG